MEQQQVSHIKYHNIGLRLQLINMYTAGVPSQNGDYLLSQGDFEFRPVTSLRPCINLIVFNDQVFEGPEDLTISLQGFVLDGSTSVTPSLSGVTIDPPRATVTIADNDGNTSSY